MSRQSGQFVLAFYKGIFAHQLHSVQDEVFGFLQSVAWSHDGCVDGIEDRYSISGTSGNCIAMRE